MYLVFLVLQVENYKKFQRSYELFDLSNKNTIMYKECS